MNRMLAILAVMAAVLMPSCRASKSVTTHETRHRDIEVRYEKSYVTDTVFVEIPAQTSERTTRDSSSHLENDYAVSDARINGDGTLYHDLRTKPQRKPVPVRVPVVRKDSIVYVDKQVEVPVMVEKDLTAWQQFRLKWFGALAALAAALAVWTFRKPLLNLIRRFI